MSRKKRGRKKREGGPRNNWGGWPRVPLTRFIISQGNGKKIIPKKTKSSLTTSEGQRVCQRESGAGRRICISVLSPTGYWDVRVVDKGVRVVEDVRVVRC